MKKLVIILMFLSTVAYGRGGPKYAHNELSPKLDDEINNIYEDMAEDLYDGGRISSGSIDFLTVSTITAKVIPLRISGTLAVGPNKGSSNVTSIASERPYLYTASTYTSVGNAHGIADYNTVAPTSGVNSYACFDARATTEGSQDFGHINGFQASTRHNSSGAIGTIYGHTSGIIESGGPVTNAYDFYAFNASIESGSIANHYAFYSENFTGATNNYGVYIVGAPSYFGGGMAPGNAGSAGIRSTVPKFVGQLYYCTNCATVPMCVSTGTLANQWALITNQASPCQ